MQFGALVLMFVSQRGLIRNLSNTSFLGLLLEICESVIKACKGV